MLEPPAPGTEGEFQVPQVSKKETEQERLLSQKANLPNGKYGSVFDLSFINGSEHWYCNVCQCPVMGRAYHHEIGKRHSANMSQRKQRTKPPKTVEPEPKEPVQIEVAPGEPVPPGFEDEVERTAQIQERLDRYSVGPLVGLEYVVELQDCDPAKEPCYLCILCDKKGDPRTVLTHLASYNHISQYLQRHFRSAYRALAPYLTKQYKRNWQICLQRIAEAIEKRFGRLRPLPVEAHKFEESRMQYLTRIAEGKHFHESPHATFEELVKKEDMTKTFDEETANRIAEVSRQEVAKKEVARTEEKLPFRKNSQQQPIKKDPSPPVVQRPQRKQKPVVKNKKNPQTRNYIQQKKKSLSPVSSASSSGLSDQEHRIRDRPLPYQRGRSPGRGVGRSRSRSPTGRRPFKRSPSPKRKDARKELPWQKASYRQRNDSSEKYPPKKSEKDEKMEEYNKLAKAIENDMDRVWKQHEKNPEKHPHYNEEWKKFWNKRYKELQAEGKDASKHDFKPEWIVYWNKQMKELHDEEVKNRKEALKKRLGLIEEPNPVKFRILSKDKLRDSPVDRKPIPPSACPDSDPEVIIIDDKEDSRSSRLSSRRSHSPWDREPPSKQLKMENHKSKDSSYRVADRRSPQRKSPQRRSPQRWSPPRRSPDWTTDQRSPDWTADRRSPDRKGDGRSLDRKGDRRSPDRKGDRRSPDRKGDRRSLDRKGDRRSLDRKGDRRSPDRNFDRSVDRKFDRTLDRKADRRPDERSVERKPDRRSMERRQSLDRLSLDRISSSGSSDDALNRPYIQEHREYRRPPPRNIYMPMDRMSPGVTYVRERDYHMGNYHPYYGEIRPPKVMREATREPVIVPAADDDDGNINIVAVLRLLTALEDKLGSLGPKVNDLLSQALAMEKNEANSSETLLESDINCVLFETVKEKLKGQLLAGLVDYIQEKAFKRAIQRCASLIHIANVRKQEKEAQNPVTVPGVGTVDKAAIAKQIATALVLQGKTDVTQEELEQLINAVVGMAEASQKSDRPMTTAHFVEQLSGALAQQKSAEAKPVEDPPKVQEVPKPPVKESPVKAKEEEKPLVQKPVASTEKSTNMDHLSDSDLQTLLQNFKDLSTEEQHGLINYLKKLEAKEPERVEKLRKFVNLGSVNPEKAPAEPAKAEEVAEVTEKAEKPLGSPFLKRFSSTNPDAEDENNVITIEDAEEGEKKLLSKKKDIFKDTEDNNREPIDSDEDYNFEDVVRSVSKNVEEKEQEKKRLKNEEKKKLDNEKMMDAQKLISNLISTFSKSSKPPVPEQPPVTAANFTASADFTKTLSNLPVNLANLANIVGNVKTLEANQKQQSLESPSKIDSEGNSSSSFNLQPPRLNPPDIPMDLVGFDDLSNGTDMNGSRPGLGDDRPSPLDPPFNRPVPGFGRPGSEFDIPGPDFDRPGPGFDRPGQGFDRPGPGFDRPGPGFDRPGPGFDRPGPGFDRPGPGFDRPGPGFDRPGPGFDRPGSGFDRPGPGFNKPGPDFDRPGPGFDREGPSGFDRQGPGFDRQGPGLNRPNTVLDRPGPGFDRPGQGFDRQFSEFDRPGFDRQDPYFDRPAFDRPDFEFDRQGPYDRQGPDHQRRPMFERQGQPSMDRGVTGFDRGGPGENEKRGALPERDAPGMKQRYDRFDIEKNRPGGADDFDIPVLEHLERREERPLSDRLGPAMSRLNSTANRGGPLTGPGMDRPGPGMDRPGPGMDRPGPGMDRPGPRPGPLGMERFRDLGMNPPYEHGFRGDNEPFIPPLNERGNMSYGGKMAGSSFRGKNPSFPSNRSMGPSGDAGFDNDRFEDGFGKKQPFNNNRRGGFNRW